jgi:hypothetical protein
MRKIELSASNTPKQYQYGLRAPQYLRTKQSAFTVVVTTTRDIARGEVIPSPTSQHSRGRNLMLVNFASQQDGNALPLVWKYQAILN